MSLKLRLVASNGFAFVNVYENDVDVFIPQMWANESINILIENMVAASLVYRDFENVLQRYGDVVNVPKPGELQAKRKTNADNVVIQDVSSDNVQVPLNQHIHTSFLIRDGEESKSFKSLVDEYLKPAIISLARMVDQIVLGQYIQFLANTAGGLGNLTGANAKGNLLALRQVLNQNRAPMGGRNLILNPLSETTLLNLDIFTQAQQVGDQGQALREATLGRKLGWDFYMDQNMPVVNPGNTAAVGAVNNVGGYPVGTTVITVDGFAAAISAGAWVTIAGDLVPHRVVSSVGGATPTSITLSDGLKVAVADNAAITTYTPGAVNNAGGYPIGYAKEITVDGFTVAPQVGQGVSFGTGANPTLYSIIAVNNLVGITLDRPLVVAIADNDTVNLGPAGAFNFAFHRNAIALVVRPLALPRQGTGALSAVANYNDVSMRIVITYQGEKQGHLVTVDMLAGVAVLDNRLGGVLLG
jgi:hypothetical protein